MSLCPSEYFQSSACIFDRLEKKLAKDGTLPPGWEKKLSKGQIIDQSILGNGRILNSKDYPYMKNSQIYQVENRVFRVAEDTKMILEIFK